MAAVTIYVEGGGDTARGLQQTRLAFGDFFSEFTGSMPKIISCGGRGKAYDDFIAAAENDPDAFIILLVDAERSAGGRLPTEHLAAPPDRWNLDGIPDDRLHMMVQAVEAWMIADRDAVRDYFGQGFNENPLPGRPPETIPKDDLKRALENAGRDTKKKGYHEISDGTEILKLLDAATVRNKCGWCRRLFTVLSRETGVALP